MDATTTIQPLCWIPNPFVSTEDKQCIHCGKLEEDLKNNHDSSSKSSSNNSSFIDCTYNCGAKLCGEACRKEADAAASQHGKLCVGPYTADHALYRLKILALEAGPVGYAMIMLAASALMIADSGDGSTTNDNILDIISSRQRRLQQNESENNVDLEENAEITNIETESHVMMIEILGKNNAPSLQEWVNLLHYIKRNYLTIRLRSRYAIESERLEEPSSSSSSEWKENLLERAGTESLVELVDEADQFFPPVENFCLLLDQTSNDDSDTSIQHSCIPNYEIQTDNNNMHTLKYHKLMKDCNVSLTTCSIIDNNVDLEERTELLAGRGIIHCDCLRCRFERNTNEDDGDGCDFSREDLDQLLELARAQERYDDAYDIEKAILSLNPKDGASLLLQSRIAGWQGDFERREDLLKEAADTVDYEPFHDALEEANAYYRRPLKDCPSPTTTEPWAAADGLDNDVFVGSGVLDANECEKMVKVAENFLDGKWTTKRHYAVPTTDIPVYKIPDLLSWFNLQLEQTIFPAMEEHFHIEGRLRIFDAFLVKYDATAGQKRLPLHNDQSEYSLTVAMNPMSDYEGGGTYFCETNDVVNTDVGGVISFRGELLHAGATITRGKRYIIVCFVYEEDVSG